MTKQRHNSGKCRKDERVNKGFSLQIWCNRLRKSKPLILKQNLK